MIKKSEEKIKEKSKLDLLVLKYQLLEDEEEKKEVLEKMIKENNGLIHDIASKYNSESVEYEDLFNVGAVGFISAAKNYTPDHDTKFSTFAFNYINGYMKTYVKESTRDIHIPFYIQYNYNRYKKEVNDAFFAKGKRPTDKEIIDYLNNKGIFFIVNHIEYKWDEEKIGFMKAINVQSETVHYNNAIADDNDCELCDTIEDTTIESPDKYAFSKVYSEELNRVFNRYRSINDDNVIELIKLRYGIIDDQAKILIANTIKRVGKDEFGPINESGKLTLNQLSLIFNYTREYIRVVSDTGVRRLQIQEGIDPTLFLRQGTRYTFINKDLNITPTELKSYDFSNYDNDIIEINPKNN